MSEKFVVESFTIPPSWIDLVNKYCAIVGVTRSEFYREAIKSFFKELSEQLDTK